MNASNYWRKRKIQNLIKSEQKAEGAVRLIQSIYRQAESNVLDSVDSIYSNYAKKGILSTSDLKAALEPTERANFYKKLSSQIQRLGLNPEAVYDERYLMRLSRLAALQEQICAEILSIGDQEYSITSKTYRDVIRGTYSNVSNQVKFDGLETSFGQINSRVVSAIVRSQWKGRNYSESIWGNVGLLADRLPVLIGGAMASGASLQKVSRTIRDEFEVGERKAWRLVRTESNYMSNQAELQTYIDFDVEEYEYMAVLDGHTSEICKGLNGEVFKVSEAEVGVNYPPMHPHCRSTTGVSSYSEVDTRNIAMDQLQDSEGDPISELIHKIPTNERSMTRGAIDVVETEDGFMVLDGQHRTAEAYRLGKKQMTCNILTPQAALDKFGDIWESLRDVLEPMIEKSVAKRTARLTPGVNPKTLGEIQKLSRLGQSGARNLLPMFEDAINKNDVASAEMVIKRWREMGAEGEPYVKTHLKFIDMLRNASRGSFKSKEPDSGSDYRNSFRDPFRNGRL